MLVKKEHKIIHAHICILDMARWIVGRQLQFAYLYSILVLWGEVKDILHFLYTTAVSQCTTLSRSMIY